MLPRALRLAGRFPQLYKLLWADERLVALEEMFARMQKAMENQRNAFENQRTALNSQRDSLENQAAILRGQAELNLEQLDMLKSSLDVPRELVEEFFEWKARSPVPEHPLVSVAVATYNRAEVLTERCIPSVLGQSYENLELIVVGDHCTDDTEEAVARIDDPRIKFVNLPEKSIYPEDPRRRWMVAGTPPTNKAFSMAQGDYITQLDDDDEYLPERLEKLVTFAGENECDFVWHPYWVEDESGERLVKAKSFSYGQVTNASAFYRSWFKKIEADINSHRLMEPGDWNRFRKIKYINPVCMRYPEPLLKYHR